MARTHRKSPARSRSATLKSINPATGELIETYSETSNPQLARILEGIEHAFQDWRRRPVADRTALLRRAAQILRNG